MIRNVHLFRFSALKKIQKYLFLENFGYQSDNKFSLTENLNFHCWKLFQQIILLQIQKLHKNMFMNV